MNYRLRVVTNLNRKDSDVETYKDGIKIRREIGRSGQTVKQTRQRV
jgi:hypothetical protein